MRTARPVARGACGIRSLKQSQPDQDSRDVLRASRLETKIERKVCVVLEQGSLHRNDLHNIVCDTLSHRFAACEVVLVPAVYLVGNVLDGVIGIDKSSSRSWAESPRASHTDRSWIEGKAALKPS